MGFRLIEERGKIEGVVFSGGWFPDNLRVENQLYDVYARLMKDIEDVTFLLSADAAPHLRHNLGKRGIETGTYKLLDGPDFIFVRDLFISSSNGSRSVIQTADYGISEDYREYIKQFVTATNRDYRHRDFIKITGGNIIASDNKSYVAQQSITDTAQRLWVMETEGRVPFRKHARHFISEARSMYRACFGGELVEIGTEDYPSIIGRLDPTHHIDMELTLPTPETAIVGSTILALDILYEQSEKERLDFGTQIMRQTGKFTAQKIIEMYRKQKKKMKIEKYLDGIATMLEKRGLKVYRLPFLDAQLDPPKGVRSYVPPITYTNVLYNGTKVYVPEFRIPFDDIAFSIYGELGYEVVPIPCAALLSAQGGLRCISNVTGRR